MGEKRGMKALELWCKRVTDGYPGVKVENMTTSWRDGLAFCALIHHFRPDLIDFSNLKKSNVFGNNELAFRTAERHLGIPALLDAEDMVEYEVPDRLSILTYLSQFYQTFASHPSSPIKRSPPESPNCSLVMTPTASSSPPKEARRREPCVVCELPVFLAQRLLLNGRLYHRTCFRCARCNAQLTLANFYETQDGAFCCETCPDEEMEADTTEVKAPDIGDKGGGGGTFIPLDISHDTAHDKTDSLVTSRTQSLVGMRRMMFENASHTDDEKLPRKSDLGGCDKPSDFINEQPNKYLSNKKHVNIEVDSSSNSRISDCNVSQKGNSHVKPDLSVDESVPLEKESDSDTSDFSLGHSDVVKATLPSNSSRPIILITQSSLEKGSSNQTKLDSTDTFSSLNSNEVMEAEAVNIYTIDGQSKLDIKNDLEPNSYSSDISIAQAKNDVMNVSDDEIEYNKLAESKESIEFELVEANNYDVLEDTDNKDSKSLNSETEMLLSHAESGSLKEPEEEIKKEDEFSSLTHNIEQLVIEANNENVVETLDYRGDKKHEEISDNEAVVVNEPKVPSPSPRTLKHKPPIPHNRTTLTVNEKKAVKEPGDEYPEDLNPFGDEEEDDDYKEKNETTSESLNPFGSSDEDEEDLNSSKPDSEEVPRPTVRRVIPAPKISLNPFWSGDEEEEEEPVAPIPKPRKVGSPNVSPEPSPRRLRPALGSLGSLTSIASRKKKPAPLPPNRQGSGTLRRKSYSAPKPPTLVPSPPLPLTTTPPTSLSASPYSLDKDNKEIYERQRQNSIVSDTSSIDTMSTVSGYTLHKSTYGRWRRKKGPAPARPVPVRRAVPPMSLARVRQELSDIEVKQQGLERQGVKLEQTIRDKFEQDGASLTPFVEEMVLQLFELVNEKNEMFRRQAELMYLRRQHNLEEEYAELEYQIRCLMLCPESNKTDSDKTREEQLIQRPEHLVVKRKRRGKLHATARRSGSPCRAMTSELSRSGAGGTAPRSKKRLVEVVERRNEIVDCLEMDRLREKEEDRSVGTQLGIFSAAVGSEVDLRTKVDKKVKKPKKEKRWSRKSTDKEAGEGEDKGSKKVLEKEVEGERKKEKSKKKWFTLHHSAKS